MNVDDASRQLEAARDAIDRRLFLLAAGLLDGAAVILRLLHQKQVTDDPSGATTTPPD